MTIKLVDALFETTTSTGTGAITLAGAQPGYQSFVKAGNGAYVLYQINDGDANGLVTQREVGIGIVNVGAPNTLTRSKILYSTNSNAAVNFGTGTKNVIGTIAAAALDARDENLNFMEGFGIGGGTANVHTLQMPTTPLAYSDGMQVSYIAPATSTGNMSLNVDSLGAKGLRINGANVPPGMIKSGSLVRAVYRSSTGFFELINTVISTTPLGQCRLTLSSGNLLLLPYAGNQLTINGLSYTIPSTGVALAPTGAAASTTYYVYAYMNGSTLTLEAVTTGHSTDAATGVEIKTGDPTRTLVGMVYATAAATWGTGAADVASWFNRRPVVVQSQFTATRTTTSPTAAEINIEIRANFLTWGDASAKFNGAVSHSVANGIVVTQITLDNLPNPLSVAAVSVPTGYGNAAQSADVLTTEGRHYINHLGSTPTAGTASWFSNSTFNGSGFLYATVNI